MSAATSVKLVIPSEVRFVDLVHEAAEKIAALAGFDAEDALNLGLAVREAVINAIVHGNRQDPAEPVEVVLSTGSRGMRIKVRDRGEGFDPESTPDPTLEDNLLKTSGRGLLLIHAFVDDVEIKPRRGRGTEVTLSKKNRPTRRASEEREESGRTVP